MTEAHVSSILSLEGTVSNENENKTLPSMPLLNPPSQPGSPAKTDSAHESDPFQSTSENEHEMSSPEKPLSLSPVKDSSNDAAYDYVSLEDCDELARGNHVSFGDKRKPLHFPHAGHPPPKKRKKQDVFDLTEGMEEEPGNHYAEAYFSKVKSMLDESMFQKFITILSEAKDEPGGAVALYKNIEELFVDYPELAEDFVGTLRPDQALEIGKLLELKFITRSLAFFKKLEGFQLTKVIHALETLASNSQLSEELVKSTILSILKGHGALAESFLHLLPNEKPPPPSSLDDYEDITEAMLEEGEDGGWETARIPEHAERGCLSDCPCRCHTTPSQPFCLACNIRFIKGQAYVQYGKVIRYCKVQFGDMTHDEVLQRFNPALYSKRRRKRKSISKTSLPPNESSKEVSEVLFQDDNANISKEDVQRSSSPGHVEDKADEDDDYWEEDDVSSGDKSSGGDMYEELDRHSEDTEDRLIGHLNNHPPPLSPLGSTVEGFYIKNGLPSGDPTDAVRGVVIDVSDIRPNGVNAHVFKFETRVSDDPCIKRPSTPEEKMADELPALQDATVIIDNLEIHPDSQTDMIPSTEDTVTNDSNDCVIDGAEIVADCVCIKEEDLPVAPVNGWAQLPVKSEVLEDLLNLNVPSEAAVAAARNSADTIADSKDCVLKKMECDCIEDSPEAAVAASHNGAGTIADSKDCVLVKMECDSNEVTELPPSENASIVPGDGTDAPVTNAAPSQQGETPEIKTGPEVENKLSDKGSPKAKESDKEWTRQEDKMILEAFQREIGTEETFARIRNLMPARSVDQIQERFQVLMNLLEKVASGSHDAHPN